MRPAPVFGRVAAGAIVSAVALASPAHAQEFPKNMRIVAGSAGGTGPDMIARLLAPKLGDALRNNVIVENRSGTNGIAASIFVARSTPDASVIMIGNAGTHGVNAALYKKLEYDPVADFAPITEIAAIPLALTVHPSVPAKSVKELIAIARASPGKLNVAIAGAAGELMGNALMVQSKTKMTNIHYKGGAAAALAVISGEADLVFTSYVVIAPHVQSGRLRVLGVSSAQRMPQLPNVPTIAESGMQNYEHEQWYGMFAPAKTPAALVQTLNREFVRLTQTPDVTERLLNTGHRIVAGTQQQLAARVRSEIDKTRQIMQAAGMPQQ